MNGQVETYILGALVYDPVGPLAVLSNFSDHGFERAGENWRSVEHYFQASKFLSKALAERIARAETPALAKQVAWTLDENVRSDWGDVRDHIMLDALTHKFKQNADAAAILGATWPLPIYEDSPTDEYWGIGASGRGLNRMGEMLAKVRALLRGDATLPLPPSPTRRPQHHQKSAMRPIALPASAIAQVDQTSRVTDLDHIKLARASIAKLVELDIREAGLHLTYNSLEDLTFGSALSGLCDVNPGTPASEIREILVQSRAKAFDFKYAEYLWFDDARSLVPDWPDQFFSTMNSAAPGWLNGRILVAGAGSGEEASHVWRRLGDSVTLMDIAPALVANCARQAPSAKCVLAPDETLPISSAGSVDTFVALRTFESALFDAQAAVMEVHRLLRPGGFLVLSVSNAYKSDAGTFIRGQISGNFVSKVTAAQKAAQLSYTLVERDFSEPIIVDLETEWLLISRKN